MSTPCEHRTIPAADGLQLFLRDWAAGDGAAEATPILCLPGLTRNSSDFELLVEELRARGDGRRVLAMDFRGRGQSGFAEDFTTYNPLQEAGDVIAAILQLVGGPAIIMGTSRGGIVGMIVSLARPDLVKALALNDIGAFIEPAGASRIMDYVGLPLPEGLDWPGAVLRVREGLENEFPGVSDAHWEAHARRTFRDESGMPAMNYDPKLRDATLAQMETNPPDLWPQFDTLPEMPMLVIRGENSDILSAETVAEMAKRRPSLNTVQLADRGHVPFLNEPPAVDAFVELLATADALPDPEPAALPAPEA